MTDIFGKPHRKLVHVNVVWSLPANTTAVQRDLLVAAGIKLGTLLESRDWPMGKRYTNVPVGPNNIVLLLGPDATGAAIEVRMDSVALQVKGKDGSISSPPPNGPARLRLSYAQSLEAPDVGKIADGQF